MFFPAGVLLGRVELGTVREEDTTQTVWLVPELPAGTAQLRLPIGQCVKLPGE